MRIPRPKLVTVMLRIVAAVPIAIGLGVVGYAAMFTYMASFWRDSAWPVYFLAIILVGVSFILFRSGYLAWRRPSPSSVRETCHWAEFALALVGFGLFSRLNSSGKEWLAWGVLVTGFVAASIVRGWLMNYLLRRV